MTIPNRARKSSPLIPQGVQCYFGEEVNRRRKVESVLSAVIRNWGFQEIILPFFDYLEDFSYGLGPHIGNQVYRFVDHDGSLLALRPDLTTLVAKTVATRMTDQELPIKLFYSGEVFRQTQAGAGRQKEFYQIGLESIGFSESWADIEIILMAIDCLNSLGVQGFKIAVGHVGFFNGIVSELNLSGERAAEFRQAIDRKDSAWLEKELGALNLTTEKKTFLLEFPEASANGDFFARGKRLIENPDALKAISELMEIESVLSALGLTGYVAFDLGEVRGLEYYTGIMLKIYSPLVGFEMGGGGRYDGLLSKFGWDLPAVGFSLTMDRILPQLRATRNLQAPDQNTPEHRVLINGCGCGGGGGSLEETFLRVWELRNKGERVLLERGGPC